MAKFADAFTPAHLAFIAGYKIYFAASARSSARLSLARANSSLPKSRASRPPAASASHFNYTGEGRTFLDYADQKAPPAWPPTAPKKKATASKASRPASKSPEYFARCVRACRVVRRHPSRIRARLVCHREEQSDVAIHPTHFA